MKKRTAQGRAAHQRRTQAWRMRAVYAERVVQMNAARAKLCLLPTKIRKPGLLLSVLGDMVLELNALAEQEARNEG